MINLYFSSGKVFVWNADDLYVLRKEHRIVGSLVGCHPKKPFQNQAKWLPLQLLPEEAKLLLDKGIAELVASPDGIPEQSVIDSYYERSEKLCEEQIILLKEMRRKTILEKADEIYEGKKRKLTSLRGKKKKAKTQEDIGDPELSAVSASAENESNSVSEKCLKADEETSNLTAELEEKSKNDLGENVVSEVGVNEPLPCSDTEMVCSEEIDKNTFIEDTLAKVPDVSKEQCIVQLFTECPWKIKVSGVKWKYPSSDAEKLRYAVFKDLWEKEFYITVGSKFGGDFLAYEGDPMKYHALYIIVCVPRTEAFQGIDLVMYGRLGNQVKKTVALASLNEGGQVEYISLNWAANLS